MLLLEVNKYKITVNAINDNAIQTVNATQTWLNNIDKGSIVTAIITNQFRSKSALSRS